MTKFSTPVGVMLTGLDQREPERERGAAGSQNRRVKFELTVDLDRLTGDPAEELGRILRYWAGAAKQLDLTTPQEQATYDSTYAEVGAWRIG
jgi:hypothetical protein